MFKILKYSAIIFIILLSATQTSFATPFTWVDNVANNSVALNNGHPDYTFTYDLTGSGGLNVLSDPSNPFHPTIDVIADANLFLDFTFDGTSSKHVNIVLDLSGTDQTLLNYSVTADKNVLLNVDAIAQLNSDGTLTLDLHRVDGTFYLTSSILTADGTDNTVTPQDGDGTGDGDGTPGGDNGINPIATPEPSTFLLLGAGILGAGLLRKRMKK